MNLHTIFQGTPAWLVDVTLHATIILSLLGGIVCLRPRMASTRRHFLFSAALLCIPLIMLGTSVAPAWSPFTNASSYFSTGVSSPKQIDIQTAFHDSDLKITTATENPLSLNSRASSPLSGWMILPLLWLAGIAVGMIWLLRATFTLRRIRATVEAEIDPRLLFHFHQAQQNLGLNLPDQTLVHSASCLVPMTWGWRRPTVLLPPQACEWSDARLRLVLHHELAHIARADLIISLLGTTSTLLLWFHPLAWWIWRSCNQAREQACDDLALVHATSNAEDFADELLTTVSDLKGFHGCVLPLALAMAGSSRSRAIKKRLANILDSRQPRASWSTSARSAWILSISVAALALSSLAACRTIKPVAPGQVSISSTIFEIATSSDSKSLRELGLEDGNHVGFEVKGVHSEAETASFLKKLKQIKGVEVVVTPNVTARNKEKAIVEVVREFIYPTKFDPPNLPDFKDGKPIQLAPGQTIAVTPTTPIAFDLKPVGVRVEYLPEIQPDGSILLEIKPELTEFEGFQNYGTPIKASSVDGDGKIRETILSESRVEVPIFRTIKLSTSVVLQEGNSVLIGGLKRPEKMQGKSANDTRGAAFFLVQVKKLQR
jgi:beta-lactamase regulating signal transducer with metallopeptidase domain